MLLTYAKTRKDCEVHAGDECEVYFDGEIYWIVITHVEESGYIRAVDTEDTRVDFRTKQELFDAIGDV